MNRYSKHFNTKETPQSQPIPGSNQVKNSAGGYSFAVDKWTRLERFLVLGSEGGSYYATEQKLTVENANSVVDCIKADGRKVVERVVEVSDKGRAPKNDPAIFVLAMCAKLGDDVTRQAARDALPKVCRIGTHLFTFAENMEAFGGWGRGTRNAVAKWYNDMPVDKLAYQAVKYQSRNGWSHRDLLRLAHPKAKDQAHNAVYKWVTKGYEGLGDDVQLLEGTSIHGFEAAKVSKSTDELVEFIKAFRLPREAVPTQYLNDVGVWRALLQDMPYTAMIRNLATMTRIGLLKGLSKETSSVVDRLSDGDSIRKARVHPIQVLMALRTYAAGRGLRGQNTWTPVQSVVDALDRAFYASFENVVPTGKRIMLAIDISGSMTWSDIAGVSGLTPRDAAAAMAMVTAATEKNTLVTAFASGITEAKVSSRMRLDQVVDTINRMPASGTDCSLPILYAQEKGLEVDAFVVYTDNETWAGRIHPSQALQQYRQKSGIPAKLVVVGMVSNGFTIADPNDAGMMDVVGFDTSAPAVMADFIR